ncbi:tail assembly protein [Cronobacter phage JC01]|uniref:Tail assembly protein n=1 Tax=Cronobacter phage JC01 TaxID=2729575 RepID=A0A6M3YKH8_9CAUD|nr:tail assembly chaperone [Cronobacter phage JC01]QJI52246.1 tail assembly protein [Cronobacter phage JC01]
MTDEPRIYMRHARAMNICGPGVERIAERMGVNLMDFLENGYPCALAEKSANPLLRKAAAMAREEWEAAHGKGQ